MKTENIGGAAIAALILFVSSLMTLFSANPDLAFGEVPTATWVQLLGACALAFFKDAKANDARKMIAKAMGNGVGRANCPAWVTMAAVLMATLSLSGCGSVGDIQRPDIDSVADAIAVTSADVESAAQTVLRLCRNTVPGGECADGAVISTDVKDSLKWGLNDVLSAISAANLALATKDAITAQTGVARAAALMAVINAEISRHQL